jgi:hypothetical protein
MVTQKNEIFPLQIGTGPAKSSFSAAHGSVMGGLLIFPPPLISHA